MVSESRELRSFEECLGVKVPTHKEVCYLCRGTGTHVNRAIDGNGIGPDDECWQDDDFREGYFSGRYDVRCEECRGANVIDVVDWDRMDAELRRELEEWFDSARETEAIYEMERRMGA